MLETPMTDGHTTINQLKALVLRFAQERDWEQFHHPKDLGLALACEVGEVLDHFRYLSNEQIQAHLADPAHHKEVAHELADCLWALLRLADVCHVDLAASLEEKTALAALKYPIEKVYGRPHKYTTYDRPH